MNRQKFPLNYIWYIFVAFMWLLAIFLIKETSAQLFKNLLSGEKTVPEVWMMILLLDILFLIGALIPTWSISKEHFTVYDDLGLKRPGLLRVINLNWKDITHIERRAYSLYLNSKSSWITINLAIYQNPEELAKHIYDCVKSRTNPQ